jgi:hypothetical protein
MNGARLGEWMLHGLARSGAGLESKTTREREVC